jgi:hypothetical protein
MVMDQPRKDTLVQLTERINRGVRRAGRGRRSARTRTSLSPRESTDVAAAPDGQPGDGGGNRHWGFDDERFGGNFNRLKNMMLQAGGAYISTDFTDFEETGFADIAALIAKYRPLTKGKLIVACGSLGNSHCWNLFHNRNTASQVDGIIVLSGFPDPRFFSSAAAKSESASIPLVISHGSWDPDYDYKPTLEFYRQIRKTVPGYPVRYILFETGKHGAPVRMIDWRDTLNWMASL